MGFASREQVQEYSQRPPGKPGYVPELFFIDRNRVIRAQYSGTEDFFKDQDRNIRAQVEMLPAGPSPAVPRSFCAAPEGLAQLVQCCLGPCLKR